MSKTKTTRTPRASRAKTVTAQTSIPTHSEEEPVSSERVVETNDHVESEPPPHRGTMNEVEPDEHDELDDESGDIEGTEAVEDDSGDSGDAIDALESHDDATDGPEVRSAEWRKLAPHKKAAIRLARWAKKLEAYAAMFRLWNVRESADESSMSAQLAMLKASAHVSDAAGMLRDLPEGWKPPRAARGTATPKYEAKVGDKVRVRVPARKLYEGVVETTDFVGLEVIAVAGKQAKVRNKHGERLVFPAKHLEISGS